MLAIVAFLETLTNRCEDGRVICSKQNTIGKGYLKFLLLNPSSHFKEIVSEARAVLTFLYILIFIFNNIIYRF